MVVNLSFLLFVIDASYLERVAASSWLMHAFSLRGAMLKWILLKKITVRLPMALFH